MPPPPPRPLGKDVAVKKENLQDTGMSGNIEPTPKLRKAEQLERENVDLTRENAELKQEIYRRLIKLQELEAEITKLKADGRVLETVKTFVGDTAYNHLMAAFDALGQQAKLRQEGKLM